jgi:Leucine-rich repeat (LRR) protein
MYANKMEYIRSFTSSFNINLYLDSLPLNTTYIDVSCRRLFDLPDLSRFTQLTVLDCSDNYLTSLPKLNKTLEYLICSKNKLTELPSLNNNLKRLNCSDNYLTILPILSEKLIVLDCSFNLLEELPQLNDELNMLICKRNHLTKLPVLNKNLKYLDCNANNLTCLPQLNDNLNELSCSHNYLTSLPILNKDLTNLYCIDNKLTCLPQLNDNLLVLDCSYNQLNYLPILNDKLITLHLNGNFIISILYGDSYKNKWKQNLIIKHYWHTNINNFKITMNNKLNILNTFRYTFYCLKFKKHFKRWLWEKVREPKIKAKYHPNHLNALEETDDLEVFLDDWINK